MQGRGGIGSHKHGISGWAGKGPRLRLWLAMQAKLDMRKPRSGKLRFSSVR